MWNGAVPTVHCRDLTLPHLMLLFQTFQVLKVYIQYEW